MPEILKISVALTGEQVSAVKAAVETGEYATTSEVIREALREWQWKRDLRGEEIARLRQSWQAGKASGPAAPLDLDQTRQDARERLMLATSRTA